MLDHPALSKLQVTRALLLVLLSGVAALIDQVLWMKQIGLLFGNTSHAAATTLASFFMGLAAGSWFLGKRVSRTTNPLRTYALLEAGIAVSATIYFVILALFRGIYPFLYQHTDPGFLRLLVKFALSLLLVFPAAFCMGGTIPVIGQYLIRDSRSFGSLSALLYGTNTLGAAIGIALAGFYLPLWLGFNGTCGIAIALSTGIAVVAFITSRNAPAQVFSRSHEPSPTPNGPETGKLTRQQRRQRERESKQPSPAAPAAVHPSEGRHLPRPVVLTLAFLSGFCVLALEVVWTRMFTQVLENSVYTFSAILVVVLLCLTIGSFASSLIARSRVPATHALSVLVSVGAVSVTATPYLFLAVTNGMELVASAGSWSRYVFLILGTAFLGIGPAAILLGMLFPYLMKAEEALVKAPGQSLGQLAACNTLGAILGSLACGFLLLEWLGMWGTMQMIAWIYAVAAILIPIRLDRSGWATKATAFLALIGILLASPRNLPVVSIDPQAAKEKVLEVWEGSDCTVSVTESTQLGTAIKINSHYSLGSTGAYMQERFQAGLPLMVKPDARSIFFLGLGSGITAGSALDDRFPEVEKVVACELVGDVVHAARKYMTDFQGFDPTGGLFQDPRATVLVEDGRHYLMANRETFDIINSDLFVPFRSGAGSLYSIEHFQASKERLNDGGLFVQWLPLYQVTEYEFSVIARTMLQAFEQVTLWRHNFQPGDEAVALIGHKGGAAIPASDIDSHADQRIAVDGKTHRDLEQLNLPLNPQTITLFYCGNLTASKHLFTNYPVNSDNHPVIEYMAPRSYRAKGVQTTPWFTGQTFADLVGKLLVQSPPATDPVLVHRTPENRRLPLAGDAFHRARIADLQADEERTRNEWKKFVSEWTNR